MAGPRVAVVEAGAWGMTFGQVRRRRRAGHAAVPRPEVADEISRTRRNERRLPGIELPEQTHATTDPARCLVDLMARESKDELADYGRWIEQLGRPSGG